MPRRLATALVLAAALLLGGGPGALGQEGDTLSVDMSVAEATEELEAASQNVEDLRAQLAVLRFERSEYVRRLEQRDARREQAARDLREARTSAEELAVEAYIGAGRVPTVVTMGLAGTDPLDYTFHTTLVRDSSDARYRAAEYYHQLREQASDAVRATVAHLDALDQRISLTELSLGVAEDVERTAAVVLARAREEQQAAARAARQSATFDGPSSAPPPDGYVPLGQWPGGPSYEQWAALRQCESSGNYQAVSPSGLYRGAYQFDFATWASVGGHGDPAQASPAEQDHRAQVLWSQRGASPWPVCGRHLL